MKRIYLVLTFFVSSFFLFSFVNADEIKINITDEMFSYLSNIDTIINTINSSCTDDYNSSTVNCNYFIRYHDDYSYSNQYFAINRLYSTDYPAAYTESGLVRVNNATQKFILSSDFSSVSSNSSYYSSNSWQAYQFDDQKRLLLYSSFDIPFRSIDNNIYTFVYNGEEYSIVNDGTIFFPTLYDLKNHFLSNISSDDTPVLTNFYSIVSSKLVLFCEQIINNYVYFSIISVFVLIFIIELIRRYFL